MKTAKEHRHGVYDYLQSIGVVLTEEQRGCLSSRLKEYVREHTEQLSKTITLYENKQAQINRERKK